MALRAVGFDYLGVTALLPGRSIFELVAEITAVAPETVKAAYVRHHQAFQLGQINRDECWSLVATELGHGDKTARVLAACAQDKPQPDDRILALADTLRAHGYRVGLLTNLAPGEWAEDLRAFGVHQHFDAALLSGETGLAKPDPRAFRLLAKQLGVATDELVFIDDRAESMAGVEALGIRPLLYESYDRLVMSLAKLGLPTA
ncbi:MAG TPA: HAD-IA family hydrolase [Candidatus Saccharimonadia bacterium]|nr:HAD-IA family hydrolase [Candidatus Saccharimonadia bacterium]